MLIARQFSRAELYDNVLRNTSGQDALKKQFLQISKPTWIKRGYERSEIEPVMQEIIAIIRTDLLRRPKNKKGRKTLPNGIVT